MSMVRQSKQLQGIFSGFLECTRFILKDLRLSVVVAQLSLGGVLISVIAMIAPQFVTEIFNQPPEAAALLFVPAGVGLVLGSAFTPNIARRLGSTRVVWAGFILLAGCTSGIIITRYIAWLILGNAFYASRVYLAVMVLLTFLIGIGLDFVNVPAQA